MGFRRSDSRPISVNWCSKLSGLVIFVFPRLELTSWVSGTARWQGGALEGSCLLPLQPKVQEDAQGGEALVDHVHSVAVRVALEFHNIVSVEAVHHWLHEKHTHQHEQKPQTDAVLELLPVGREGEAPKLHHVLPPGCTERLPAVPVKQPPQAADVDEQARGKQDVAQDLLLQEVGLVQHALREDVEDEGDGCPGSVAQEHTQHQPAPQQVRRKDDDRMPQVNGEQL